MVLKTDIDTYEKSLQLGSYVPNAVQEIFLEGILVNSSAILVIRTENRVFICKGNL